MPRRRFDIKGRVRVPKRMNLQKGLGTMLFLTSASRINSVQYEVMKKSVFVKHRGVHSDRAVVK